MFTAHITGNLVILASRIVSGDKSTVAPMLSVPVFMAVIGLTRLLVGGLESIGLASLRPLLLLQLLLLAGFFVICVAAGPAGGPVFVAARPPVDPFPPARLTIPSSPAPAVKPVRQSR